MKIHDSSRALQVEANSPAAKRMSLPMLHAPVSWLLLATFLVGLALRIAVALRFPSIEWPDEIYNTLEPAHRLAYGYGVIVWEWREGIRSWVLPAVLAGVMRATDWMGPGSAGYLTAMVVLLSLLSLTAIWFGYAWSVRAGSRAAGIIAAVACAFWYELVYFAPKAFSEVIAGHLLLPGLYLGMYGEKIPEKRRLFLAGLFLGTAVAIRMQLAPVALFAAVYFCYKRWAVRGWAMFAGLLLPIAAFGLVDAITWSYPFQSYIRYVQIVVLEKKSLNYGIEPWYFFLRKLVLHFGPLLLLALVGVRRSPFLGWVAFILVGSHSLLAHKELRFIYPAIPIVLTLAALGFVEIAVALKKQHVARLSSKAVVIPGLAFFALTSGIFAWQYPRWNHDAGGLIGMDRLSRDSSVCGVGIYEVGWHQTGGYSHLHRNVPIILLEKKEELDEKMPSFNALLTGRPFTEARREFETEGCWDDVCLYRRPGSCTASAGDNEINKMLREQGR